MTLLMRSICMRWEPSSIPVKHVDRESLELTHLARHKRNWLLVWA